MDRRFFTSRPQRSALPMIPHYTADRHQMIKEKVAILTARIRGFKEIAQLIFNGNNQNEYDIPTISEAQMAQILTIATDAQSHMNEIMEIYDLIKDELSNTDDPIADDPQAYMEGLIQTIRQMQTLAQDIEEVFFLQHIGENQAPDEESSSFNPNLT